MSEGAEAREELRRQLQERIGRVLEQANRGALDAMRTLRPDYELEREWGLEDPEVLERIRREELEPEEPSPPRPGPSDWRETFRKNWK